MAQTDHYNLVDKQFSPRADAYVASAVHAQGEDLVALSGFARDNHFGQALDIGCGGGHASYTLAPHVGTVTAYDLSEEMLAAVAVEAKRRGISNLATARGPAERLPFADASFDLAATRFSAHHWHDVPAALAEARRVIRTGGRIAVMDAVAPEEPLLDTFLQTIEMLRDPSHVRDYKASEWLSMLRKAGFSPAEPVRRRLPLDFKAWIARMQTPAVYADAIRKLEADISEAVRRHFEITPDGGFTLDTVSLVAVAV